MPENYLAMKKILLLCVVACSVFAANAQTKKSTKKSKKPSKEAIAQAKFKKQEEEKKLVRTAYMDSLKVTDSMRLTNDSLADVQKEMDRVAYKDAGLKAIDSVNKSTYATLMKQRNDVDQSAKTEADLAKAAKLSAYEATQVKYINEQYNAKAKAITEGSDAQTKKAELIALNEERRSKIKTIVGKAQERRLEKERKSYVAKNGADADSQWVDMAEQFAKAN